MKRLLLIRHGQTAANAEGRIISLSDPRLDGAGCKQAEGLGRLLRPIRLKRILSSPRLRALETARIVAAHQFEETPVDVDERLREIGLGRFEGLTLDEIKVIGLHGIFESWRQGRPPRYPPGAETFEDAARRIRPLFDEIVTHLDGAVAVVGHSHSLRILIADCVLGVSAEVHRRLRIDHGSLTEIRWEGHAPRLSALGARVCQEWAE